MYPSPSLMMGAARPFRFVTSNTQGVTTSAPVVSYSGAGPGNLCVIVVTAPSPGLSAPGYSAVQSYAFTSGGGGDNISLIYKFLTNADIAAGSVTLTTGGGFQGILALFYEGCSAATLKSSNDVVAGAVTVAGFTKSSLSKAVLSVASDRGAGALTIPAFFTTRVASFSWTVGTDAAADVVSASYANGAGVTWGGGGGGNSYGASLIELT